MYLKQLITYFVCVAFVVSCVGSQKTTTPSETTNEADQALLGLIENAPAANAAEREWLYGELAAKGPAVIQQLTDMLLAPGIGDDTSTRYALNGLTKYVSQPGAEQERIMYEKTLLKALQKEHPEEVKVFLMEQLEIIGTDASIPVLHQFIGAGRLHESAVHALRAIDTPKTHAVLLQALANTEGAQRIAVIKALGDLQLPAAAEELLPYATAEDWATRQAALYALAQTGNPAAIDPIAAALDNHEGYQKTRVMSFYVLLAKRLGEKEQQHSTEICKELLSGGASAHIKSAALTILTQNEGAEALDELLNAATDGDAHLRTVALTLLADNTELSPPQLWLEALDEQSAPVQTDAIAILGTSDDILVESVKPFLDSDELSVRKAAIGVVAEKDGEQALPLLLDMLAQAQQEEEIAALKQALLQLPTQPLVTAAAERLPSVSAQTKLALIDILAQRNASDQLDAVLGELEDASPQLRLAILGALDELTTPSDISQLIDLLAQAQNEEERSAIQGTIVQVASNNDADGKTNQAVIEALTEVPDAQKPALLAVLPGIGGEEALQAVVTASKSNNTAVQQAALLALTRWPHATAVVPLQNALKNLSTDERSALLPGYIRLVAESNYASEDKAQFLNELLQESSSPKEKATLIAGLARLSSNKALQVVASYFDAEEQSVRDQAYQSAAQILARSKDAGQSLSLLTGVTDAASKKVAHYMKVQKDKQQKANGEQNSDAYLPAYNVAQEEAKGMNVPPEGFTTLFNGKNLKGWNGLVGNPESRAKMSSQELAEKQEEANKNMQAHWLVRNGILYFDGNGHSIVTEKEYKDFVMLVDWKIEPGGDSGIYLRGTPQVQIWDITEWPQGSGGLYNNQNHPNDPLVAADNPVGEWNSMRIKMIGEEVTVHLNGELVVPGVVMENYWNRDIPIYSQGQIELQSHSTPLYFRNIFIQEIPRSMKLFNDENLNGWVPVGGHADSWHASDGVLYTEGGGGGWLSTAETYDNFKLELEYRLPEGGNSGVFLRAPREGNPAYQGIEIQLLDDHAEEYADLQSWQYTGSIYDVQAPSQNVSKEAGTWQKMVIIVDGPNIKVIHNGQIIINTSLVNYMDRVDEHPGLKRRSGYIGLQNHHSRVEFRNITITEIK